MEFKTVIETYEAYWEKELLTLKFHVVKNLGEDIKKFRILMYMWA